MQTAKIGNDTYEIHGGVLDVTLDGVILGNDHSVILHYPRQDGTVCSLPRSEFLGFMPQQTCFSLENAKCFAQDWKRTGRSPTPYHRYYRGSAPDPVDDSPTGYGMCPYGAAPSSSGYPCQCDKCIRHRARYNEMSKTLEFGGQSRP